MSKCPECGTLLGAEIRLCPNCGTLIDQAAKTQPSRAWLRSRPTVRLKISPAALIVGLFACIMLFMVAASGVAGYYQGLRDREERTLETAALHFLRGQQQLQAKKYEMAIAEFEYVLQIAPDYPRAAELLAETRRQMAIVPTPTPDLSKVSIAQILNDLFQKGQTAFQAKDWGKAAESLGQVRAIDPTYEKATVEDMLYTARYNYGMKLLSDGSLEEGIFYLDQAAELRPLDPNAALQRRLAAMYITACGYWGVNWQRAIDRFTELYAIAPGYRDTARRLIEAHVNYGDQYVKQQDYCPAEQVYSDALKFGANPAIQAKQADAHQKCLSATPTPITGTVVISGTPIPLTGLPTGRLAYPMINDRGLYDVLLLNASTQRFEKIISGGDQPALHPNSPMVAYRSPGIGINVYNYATNSDKTIVRDTTAAWPTWSPDGKRLAYSSKDTSDSWRTYIVSLDAPNQPKVIASGWRPAWNSKGALAYTGCGAGGVCGIFVMLPDQIGVPPVKLTADRNDIALAWSPDGQNIAYMSNHTGNWDIYNVTTAGSVRQLTSDSATDGLPAWAPDGSGIAFLSNRGGSWGLYIMNPDGSNQRKILDLGSRMPAWQDQRISWMP